MLRKINNTVKLLTASVFIICLVLYWTNTNVCWLRDEIKDLNETTIKLQTQVKHLQVTSENSNSFQHN